jgi:hypothetical protein
MPLIPLFSLAEPVATSKVLEALFADAGNYRVLYTRESTQVL